MVALRIGIVPLLTTDSPHDRPNGGIAPDRLPELCPIVPLPARNDVVDRGGSEPLVVEVSVKHEDIIG